MKAGQQNGSAGEALFSFMMQEQSPFYVCFIFQFLFSSLSEGFLSSTALQSLTALPIVCLVFKGLGRLQGERVRLLAGFGYYQVVQLMQLLLALQYPNLSYLYIIASTILLMHLEILLCMWTVQSVFLVGKLIAMWCFYAWKSGQPFQNWNEIWVSLFWSLFHFWNCVERRKATMREMQANLREIQAEKERMQALLQAIPDGVVVITEDRKVVTYNHMIGRMLNLEEYQYEKISAALSKLFYAVSYKKTATKCENLLEDVMEHIAREKENTSIDFGSVVHMGHYLEWRGTTSQWNQSKACILVVRDVGEWVELEALAKKESEAKSALIRSVSHELRTPINAIINISERLMESSSLGSDQKEQCQILVSSSNFLLSNVNDLLDFSRLANQQFSLNKQLFKLEETVRTCTGLIKPQCHLKNLNLSFRYDSSIPPFVYNDQNRLRQVLLNLLSNAVKFTLKGKIEVIVMLLQPNVVKITVEDTGIGIDEAHQGKIFTLFGKLTGNERLNPQGCGLGLAISNTLVTRMGGEGIAVKSVPRHGSAFSFVIPIGDEEVSIDKEEREPASTDCYESEENDASVVTLPVSDALWKECKATTLIADDSEFNRLVLRQLLESQGYLCEEANTGAEALRRVEARERENSPYLYVFLDIEMPEMSGIEVAMELRRQVGVGTLTKAHVVGCSAYVSVEDQRNCLEAGMDYFLEKPVSTSSLTALFSQIHG